MYLLTVIALILWSVGVNPEPIPGTMCLETGIKPGWSPESLPASYPGVHGIKCGFTSISAYPQLEL